MGIEKFIEKVTVQTAVYWGSPQNDGYGGFTFADPVELSPPANGVRWVDKIQVVVASDGSEVTSDSEILVNQDLDLDGYLFLGKLSDLTNDEKADPMKVNGARLVLSKSKIPMVRSTTEFVRMVYLKRE